MICADVRTQLLELNLTMTIESFPRAVQFTKTGTRGEPFDMTLEGWHADYLDPLDFLFLFDGRTLRPFNNFNFAYFNDPVFNGNLDAANALAGSARFDAFGDLDVDLARNAAPWAPYMVPNDRYFFSDRIGCHTYVPAYTISLGALCLRGDTTGADPPAGGTVSTDPEADGAGPADPLETAVTTPVAGHVSIEETPSGTPVAGYNILGQQVFIQAPAATAANPLRLVFVIDGSLAPSYSDVQVFRNGTVVANCTGAVGEAVPDPCVSLREQVFGDDARLTVLTSGASRWNFGYANPTPPPPPPPPPPPRHRRHRRHRHRRHHHHHHRHRRHRRHHRHRHHHHRLPPPPAPTPPPPPPPPPPSPPTSPPVKPEAEAQAHDALPQGQDDQGRQVKGEGSPQARRQARSVQEEAQEEVGQALGDSAPAEAT